MGFDQSEHAQGPIYIIMTDTKQLPRHFVVNPQLAFCIKLSANKWPTVSQ